MSESKDKLRDALEIINNLEGKLDVLISILKWK